MHLYGARSEARAGCARPRRADEKRQCGEAVAWDGAMLEFRGFFPAFG